MRKMLTAAVASLAVAGAAAVIAGAAQAQPYGYYTSDGYYAYRYDPPRAYDAYGNYLPYGYYNGYNGYTTDTALGAAILGAVIAPSIVGHAPVDRFGPDPNGMVATDGHVIKCKLVTGYDSYLGRYGTRRECW
jgi:hypothetical protein